LELSVNVSEAKEPDAEVGRLPCTLDSLPPGAAARVVCVGGSGAVARRLMEMGVVPGAPVRVIKTAPLGDPLEIRVRNYHLALRRSEAQTISVVTSDE
jgi:ferrous iron transport protein A